MSESYALVLSGGGAKGVYHVGVWKALREMGVKVEAFVGSSVGAVTAAFLAQGIDYALEDLAGRIGLDFILNIPENLVENGELKLNRGNRKSFRRFCRSVIAQRGLDTRPLRELLKEYIDEDKIRARGKDLGIVAYNITEMRPIELFIDQMEQGTLVNYVMASTALPGFQQPSIDGKRCIDGGIFDNIPFTMARRRGYRNIIVSDIGGLGVNRRPNTSHIRGTRTVYIRASQDMGGVLNFNREFLNRFLHLGYLDTMRTFGNLHGRRYFIRPDSTEEQRFDAFLGRRDIQERLERFWGDWGGGRAKGREGGLAGQGGSAGEGWDKSVIRLFPKSLRHHRPRLPMFVDCAARMLSLEVINEWGYREICDELTKQAAEIRRKAGRLDNRSRRRGQRSIRRDKEKRRLLHNPYFYFLLVGRCSRNRVRTVLYRLLDEVFPELPPGVFFLEILEDYVHAGSECGRRT